MFLTPSLCRWVLAGKNSWCRPLTQTVHFCFIRARSIWKRCLGWQRLLPKTLDLLQVVLTVDLASLRGHRRYGFPGVLCAMRPTGNVSDSLQWSVQQQGNHRFYISTMIAFNCSHADQHHVTYIRDSPVWLYMHNTKEDIWKKVVNQTTLPHWLPL